MHLLLDAVFRDIEAAKERVLVECYIFNDDKLGEQLDRALSRARARGVDVRLLYDPLGCQKTPQAWFDGLCERGVDCRGYRNTLKSAAHGHLLPRDHGRVIVADGAGYTGGAAWGDQWLPADQGGEGWHDVCCRIEGPVVDDLVRVFETRWQEAEAHQEHGTDVDSGARHSELRLLADTPSRKSLVFEEHVKAFRRAERRIWIENAYFVPPVEMMNELYAARERGVEVQVILPADSDLPLLKRAARSDYPEWLEGGLEVFEYTKVMMHSKFAVVDDAWCSVGTFNANFTSVAMSNEVNLFVFHPEFVARVAAQFEHDRARSERVTPEQLAERPVTARAADAVARTVVRAGERLWGPGEDPTS